MLGLWRIRNWREGRRAAAALWRAEAAVDRFPVIAHRRAHPLPHRLIVSLTSFPPRFPTLAKTLKSLLDQTVAADCTVLWLAHDDVAALPTEVRALEQQGLTIRTCDDLRSYKKLIPALAAFPDAAIVTADDDTYYPSDWLETLAIAAAAEPSAILAHRCHVMVTNPDGTARSYREWPKETEARDDPEDGWLFPTGVGGVLYPPGALAQEVSDVAAFQALCPQADDVWFFWMALRAGTARRRVGDNLRLVQWGGSQEVALYHANALGGENDSQIRNMLQRFGPLPKSPQSGQREGARPAG